MLVMSKGALSLGQAETYYQEKYSHDDYYSESHSVIGQWYGKAASALGLEGEVSEEQFRAVLRGLDPNTGAVLVNAAAGQSERRAGWDATFNAPKSVSIQALVGGRREIDASPSARGGESTRGGRAFRTGAATPRRGMGYQRKHRRRPL